MSGNSRNILIIYHFSSRMQATLFQTAKEHLKRLSDVDSTVAGTAQFIALYIGGQLLFAQILESGLLSNPGTLTTQQSNIVKSQITQLLEHCLKLQYFFVGFGPQEWCAVKQFKLKVLALNLVYIVKGMSNHINQFIYSMICVLSYLLFFIFVNFLCVS